MPSSVSACCVRYVAESLTPANRAEPDEIDGVEIPASAGALRRDQDVDVGHFLVADMVDEVEFLADVGAVAPVVAVDEHANGRRGLLGRRRRLRGSRGGSQQEAAYGDEQDTRHECSEWV
jgi:hypothetical protein